MKKFIETANQSAEMCVIGLYSAWEIAKTYSGVNHRNACNNRCNSSYCLYRRCC